jgi:hypothetical protein
MINLSLEIKRQVDVKICRISRMELALMYPDKTKPTVTFYDMMDETQDLLDTTMPTKKTYNTNTHQNLY